MHIKACAAMCISKRVVLDRGGQIILSAFCILETAKKSLNRAIFWFLPGDIRITAGAEYSAPAIGSFDVPYSRNTDVMLQRYYRPFLLRFYWVYKKPGEKALIA